MTDVATPAPAKRSSRKSASASTRAVPAPKAKKAGPPKLALEGNKWVIENQVGNKSIVISETEPKHTVYIYKCTNSVVVVKAGKFRVERIIYRGSHAHVEHLSEPLPMEEAIRFLDSYGGLRGGAR